MKALIDTNRRITTHEITERLNLSNLTIHDLVKRLGLISKLGIWISRGFTKRNLLRRINDCHLLLEHQEND